MSYGYTGAAPGGYELGGQQQYDFQDAGAGWTFDDLPAVDDWPAWNEPAGADGQLDDDFEPTYRNHYSSSPDLSPPSSQPADQSHERQSHEQAPLAASMGASSSNLYGVNERHQNHTDLGRENRPTSFGYNPDYFYTLSDTNTPNRPQFTTQSSDISYNAVPLSDDEEEELEADMAPSTRRRTQPRPGVVDLTDSPQQQLSARAPAATAPRKRRASGEEEASRSTKRTKPASAADTISSSPPEIPEELDLTADGTTESLLQKQQASTIAAQQADEQPDVPIKIGKRTCIICMEPYTNATVTLCGHIYCHECLTQALKAGEKNSERGTGNCPMCRKPVSRKKNQIVPIAFMKRSAFKGKQTAGV